MEHYFSGDLLTRLHRITLDPQTRFGEITGYTLLVSRYEPGGSITQLHYVIQELNILQDSALLALEKGVQFIENYYATHPNG